MADQEALDIEALMDEGVAALDTSEKEEETKDEVEDKDEAAQDDDTSTDESEATSEESEETEDDITATDIREALGDKSPTDVSDDDLVKLYGEDKEDKDKEEEEKKWDRAWDFVDAEGKSIEAEWKKATLDARLKYQADGQEQIHSVEDLLRLASRLPNVENRSQILQEQRNAAAKNLAEAQAVVDESKKDKEYWTWIMQDPTGQRFVEAQEKFQAAGPGTPVAEPATEAAPEYSPEVVERGTAYYQQTIVPYIKDLASRYTPDGQAPTADYTRQMENEIDRNFRFLAEADAGFLTEQRLSEILERDIPFLIQQARIQTYVSSETPAAEQENIELKAELANLRTERAKEKLKGAPGSGSTSGPAGSTAVGIDLKNIQTAAEIKAMLEDPDEDFGL